MRIRERELSLLIIGAKVVELESDFDSKSNQIHKNRKSRISILRYLSGFCCRSLECSKYVDT